MFILMSGDYSATYAGDWFSLTTKRPVYGHADSHALVHHWVLGPTGRCLTCCRTGQGKGKTRGGGGLINQWESGSVRIRGKKARQERGKPLVGVEKKGERGEEKGILFCSVIGNRK